MTVLGHSVHVNSPLIGIAAFILVRSVYIRCKTGPF